MLMSDIPAITNTLNYAEIVIETPPGAAGGIIYDAGVCGGGTGKADALIGPYGVAL